MNYSRSVNEDRILTSFQGRATGPVFIRPLAGLFQLFLKLFPKHIVHFICAGVSYNLVDLWDCDFNHFIWKQLQKPLSERWWEYK